ncbi:MAG: CPBP family intramembrane metalloprotease [Planctomycetia bacterium]|nr:CPBP family intramembrane metalloprotease [Planctomycetia bacterium]
MPNAQAAIVIMMLTTSVEVWWQWRKRHKETGFIWPQSELSNAPVNLIAVLLTLAMIGVSLVSAFSPTRSDINAEKDYSINNVLIGCALNATLVVVLLPILSAGSLQVLNDLGFRLTNWRQQFMEGMQTALASFLPVMLVLLATFWIRTPQATHPLLKLLQQDGQLQTFAAVVLAAVILAPLVEELMFRVILLGWLKTKTNSTEAIVISSVAFAAVHGPLDGIALMPLALLLGFLYDRRRSYWSVFVAHAFFNLTNVVQTMSAR